MDVSPAYQLREVVLRPADVAECLAGCMTPLTALNASIRLSQVARVYEDRGRPVCWYGWAMTGVFTDTVDMWMLSTPLADQHKVWLARESRRIIADLHQTFRRIRVIAHDRHYVALKWLDWLGFKPVRSFGPFIELVAER